MNIKEYKIVNDQGQHGYIWATSLAGALAVAREHGCKVEVMSIGNVVMEAE